LSYHFSSRYSTSLNINKQTPAVRIEVKNNLCKKIPTGISLPKEIKIIPLIKTCRKVIIKTVAKRKKALSMGISLESLIINKLQSVNKTILRPKVLGLKQSLSKPAKIAKANAQPYLKVRLATTTTIKSISADAPNILKLDRKLSSRIPSPRITSKKTNFFIE
jgi:hypothetical protein